MFAQMQGNIKQKYQGLSFRHRQQAVGAAAAGTALGAIKVLKGPVGKFGLQVAKIGILAKAIQMPGKLVHFGMKAHRLGRTRRLLKRASTVATDTGIYFTKKGEALDPQLVSLAQLPFRKRLKGLIRTAL